MEKVYLAFDLGASSGRLMAAAQEGDQLKLTEIHRFINSPVWMGERLYWDIPYLLREMKEGLKKVAEQGLTPASIGIDTWGVDYGYVAEDGSLLGLPFCYRDPKNQPAMEGWDADPDMPSFETIYQITGLQKINFNTAYQIYYDVKNRPEVVKAAKHLLFLPDLLTYFLTGEVACEYTIASTSMLLDARTRNWSAEMLKALQLPEGLLPPVRMPGQLAGTLSLAVQQETGLGAVPVALVGGHDTASAVAGTPFTGKGHAFISSGTWSLLGLECEEPIISPASYQANFTNEGGVCGRIRFLKNISGLWIIQQLRKEWNTDFGSISREAEAALGCPYTVDPDDASFTAPISMEAAVRSYCLEHGQGEPKTRGEIAAAVYQGLTSKEHASIAEMEDITGQEVPAIHMVGGGIQDTLLCRLAAEKTGKPVLTGPIEAAALGNVLLQQMALGELSSLEEGRQNIGRAYPLTQYNA